MAERERSYASAAEVIVDIGKPLFSKDRWYWLSLRIPLLMRILPLVFLPRR
jgi:hypothetical protein